MTTNLHAHVYTDAVDCDGPFYSNYVTSLNDDEIAMHIKANGVNDFHDLAFKERVLGSHVSFHSECEVRTNETGFRVLETTEEGYRSVEVTWCEDEACDPDARSQRDVFAEQMGY